MNIRAWAASLEKEFYVWGSINAYPRVPLPYIEVLESVQGMTTPSTMHLLNRAVRHMEPGECYLEVGTWRGATLIGALLGNEMRGYAIDNDTMDEHNGDDESSQKVWKRNVKRFGMESRAFYLDADVPAIFERNGPLEITAGRPAGVYLFDGDKSTEEAAYAGLSGAIPFLASEALIFVDDANEITIRMAAHKLCTEYPQQAIKILDIPTPGNCWPMFWNGIMAIAWRA